MSRMKKKWLRGGVSFALMFSLVLPCLTVNATAPRDKERDAAADSDNTRYVNEKNGTATEYYGDTYTKYTFSGNSLASIDNDANYIVRIPKAIKMTSQTKANEEVTWDTNKEPIVSVHKCDLAPTQTITVSVPSDNIELHNWTSGKAQGSATKEMKVYFKDGSTETSTATIATAPAGTNLVVANGSVESGFGQTSNLTDATVYVKFPQALHAGVWYGYIDFTIDANIGSGKPSDIDTSKPASSGTGD